MFVADSHFPGLIYVCLYMQNNTIFSVVLGLSLFFASNWPNGEHYPPTYRCRHAYHLHYQCIGDCLCFLDKIMLYNTLKDLSPQWFGPSRMFCGQSNVNAQPRLIAIFYALLLVPICGRNMIKLYYAKMTYMVGNL
jgi:hypothetical protein